MTNEETITEVLKLVNELKTEFQQYTNELKTYVDMTVENHNKISVSQVDSIITHAKSLDDKFNSYVSTIVEKLELNESISQKRADEIVSTNKLIAAASLSPYFGDPIGELNKLIGNLK